MLYTTISLLHHLPLTGSVLFLNPSSRFNPIFCQRLQWTDPLAPAGMFVSAKSPHSLTHARNYIFIVSAYAFSGQFKPTRFPLSIARMSITLMFLCSWVPVSALRLLLQSFSRCIFASAIPSSILKARRRRFVIITKLNT